MTHVRQSQDSGWKCREERLSFCWERTQLGGKHQEETGAEKWGRGENRKEEVRTQNKPLGPAIPEASACWLLCERNQQLSFVAYACFLLFANQKSPDQDTSHMAISTPLSSPSHSEPELGLGEGIIGEAREERTLRIRRQPRLREEARDQAIPL